MTTQEQRSLVIYTPEHPTAQDTLFVGLFGQIVERIDIEEGESYFSVQFDKELVECSTMLKPYENKLFQLPVEEATVIEVPSESVYQSLRATLAHALGQRWANAYELVRQSGHSSLVLDALTIEQNTATAALERIIEGAQAKPLAAPIVRSGLFVQGESPESFDDARCESVSFLTSPLTLDADCSVEEHSKISQRMAFFGAKEKCEYEGDYAAVLACLGEMDMFIVSGEDEDAELVKYSLIDIFNDHPAFFNLIKEDLPQRLATKDGKPHYVALDRSSLSELYEHVYRPQDERFREYFNYTEEPGESLRNILSGPSL